MFRQRRGKCLPGLLRLMTITQFVVVVIHKKFGSKSQLLVMASQAPSQLLVMASQLLDGARRRANKVQLKKVYAFYTEEDTELLWFAQVLEKPRVVVQGDIVCGTRATAANVREE